MQLDNGLCVDRMQLATGLLVACELFPEFGGHGLRYTRGTRHLWSAVVLWVPTLGLLGW